MLDTASTSAALARPAGSFGVRPVAASAASTSGRIAFIEPANGFLSLAIRNFVLTVLTAGIYHFWARIEVRKKLMGALRVDGVRVAYTGTGLEGFMSFFVAILVAGPIIYWAAFHMPIAGQKGVSATALALPASFRAQRLLLSIPLMFFIGSVVYRRRQHILRRTMLGALTFDQTGNSWAYALRHVLTAFTVPPTLGWMGPWRTHRLTQRMIGEMTLDGRPFHYTGQKSALYRPFAALWFGGIGIYVATLLALGATIGADITYAAEIKSLAPILTRRVLLLGLPVVATGLLAFAVLSRAYRAEVLNYTVSHIACGETKFRLSLPAFEYAMASLCGAALKIASFGVLSPVADAQIWRLLARHLDIEGQPLAQK